MTNEKYTYISEEISVVGANALHGELVAGIPPMTCFLGLMDFITRSIIPNNIKLTGVNAAIYNHRLGLCGNQNANKGRSISRRKFPLKSTGQNASDEILVNVDFTCRLIFSIESPPLITEGEANTIKNLIKDKIRRSRIAGGTVIPTNNTRNDVLFGETTDFQKIQSYLRFSSMLVCRNDKLQQVHKNVNEKQERNSDSTSIIGEYVTLFCDGSKDDTGKFISNRHKGSGWLVPISVGYNTICSTPEPRPLGSRCKNTNLYIVETVYGVGEWKSPRKITTLDQMLWYSNVNLDTGEFRCKNNYLPDIDSTEYDHVDDDIIY